ncbi:type I restriction enzyme HsdR N-terminal domain-containing protein, partial [Candidatus Bathyarchaeota archaeon]|nr:type I restriction enzyme HsdR N-terminal domain-containing protein [Candidatus Bathyarchaeota archaeon]
MKEKETKQMTFTDGKTTVGKAETPENIRDLKEREIEEQVVIPFLRDYLGYDVELMKKQFPVRFGGIGGTKYADLVFFVVVNDVKKPYLVVEVKTP